MNRLNKGLGRLYKPDTRDRAYGLNAAVLRDLTGEHPAFKPVMRTTPWHTGELLDQNGFNECVIYSFEESMEAAPKVFDLPWSISTRHAIYDAVRAIDGIPMPHEGTTARAICSYAKNTVGLLDAYYWVLDTETAIEWLTQFGTLLAGTDWFPSMFDTDKHGYVEPSGTNPEGLGHEYMTHWYYPPSHRTRPDTFEFRQSWGRWGYNNTGRFFMKRDAFEYLMWQLNGDLVLPVQKASLYKL